MEYDPQVFVGVLIPIAGIAFVTIAVWLTERRKEREFLQRNELLKKIAESREDATERVLEMINQQEEEAQIRRREGTKLGGLMTLSAGIGLMIFLAVYYPDRTLWAVGFMPIFVGAVLTVYAIFMAPKARNSSQ